MSLTAAGIAIAVALASAIAVRIVRRIALSNALLDVPNERSSHQMPVPRLGGAAFVPIVILALVWGPFATGWDPPVALGLLGGALALYLISLADDFRSVAAGIRFSVQFLAAVTLLLAMASVWPVESAAAGRPDGLQAWLLPPAAGYWALALWIVGLLNIYNFMDGIDGIAGLQAVAGGVTWAVIGFQVGAPQAALLALCVGAGALGFLTLNWPPAKIFMGDAGSTVLGYIFAALPLLIVVETRASNDSGRLLLAGALVVWPFLADGTFTLLRRVKRRENVLLAHRSHLYQRLVIAGQSHLRVALVYGVLAALGGVLAWFVVAHQPWALGAAIIVPAAGFAGLWFWVVRADRKAAGGKATKMGRPT